MIRTLLSHLIQLQVRKKQPSGSSVQQDFLIDGTSCASCVAKIEAALNRVPDVSEAEMNFALRTVSVVGSANADELIKAVEDAGYKANVSAGESEMDALDEKESEDLAYHQRLIKQTWVALGLGVPLMAYALITGEMNVNTTGERIAWLIVGLLTLAVLIVSGKNFYLGAWKSLVNHSANMDTLIELGTGTAWLYSMVVVFPQRLFRQRQGMFTLRPRR